MTDPVNPESNPYSSPQQPNPYASSPSNPYASTGAPKTPVLSLISMISGIVGLLIGVFGFGIIFAIGAVVLGHLGQKKEPQAKGFWLTGLITGYVGILFNVAVIVIAIVFTGFIFSQIPTEYNY